MSMRIGEMTSHDKAVADELERDPAFRREWERTALAREVAVAIQCTCRSARRCVRWRCR